MYEIYSWGNNDALYQVFNGIAAIMNGGDYMDLIKVVALMAMMAAVIGGMMTGRFTGFNWFFGMMVVYGVLFVPKATVTVVDRLNINPPVTIANVPLGLAFFGHVTSKIGDYLTNAFETVFTVPSAVKYSGRGLLFGDRMILAARQQTSTNPALKKDLNSFIRNCTYYDIKDGRITLDQIVKSNDLWTTMAATSLARTTTLTAINTPVTCNVAYGILTGDIATELANVKSQYATMTYPNQTNNALAVAQYDTDVPEVYSTMLGIATTSDSIIRQNMVMNAMTDSSMVLADELNDVPAASLALSVAQTEAVANTNYQTMAKVAADALPKIRNVLEVVILSVFPFVFLLFLLPVNTAMMALKGYIFTLLWIQLWPPLYAVLNLVATQASAMSMTADSTANSGYCLLSILNLTHTGISDQAIAGFMVFSIPAISWAILRGGGEMLGSVVGSVSQPIASAASTAAQQIATGNLSYGNVSYHNQNAFNRSLQNDNLNNTSANNETRDQHNVSPFYGDQNKVTYSGAGGSLVVDQATGATYFQGTQSSGAFNANATERITQSLTNREQNSITSALRAGMSHDSEFMRVAKDSNHWSHDETAEGRRAWQVANELSTSFSDAAGTGTSRNIEKGFRAQGGVEGHAGGNIGLSKNKSANTGGDPNVAAIEGGGPKETTTVGKGASAGLNLSGSAGVFYNRSTTDSDDRNFRSLDDAVHRHGFSSVDSWAEAMRHSKTFENLYAQHAKGVESMAASLDEAHQASVARDTMAQYGHDSSVNVMNPVVQELLASHGIDARQDPQAAERLLSEYLTNNTDRHSQELGEVAMSALGRGDIDSRARASGPKWTMGPVPGAGVVRQFNDGNVTSIQSGWKKDHLGGPVEQQTKKEVDTAQEQKQEMLDKKQSLSGKQVINRLGNGAAVRTQTEENTGRKEIKK